jgi:hypothetical protein
MADGVRIDKRRVGVWWLMGLSIARYYWEMLFSFHSLATNCTTPMLLASDVEAFAQYKADWRVYGQSKFLIDKLPVRIHLIIEMISVDRPRAMGV